MDSVKEMDMDVKPLSDLRKTPYADLVITAWRSQANKPDLEELPPADESELKQYFKELRRHFVTGGKTSPGLDIEVHPVFLAPCLRKENPETGFPTIYVYDDQGLKSLQRVLREASDEFLKSGEGEGLALNLSHIALSVREAMGQTGAAEFGPLVADAVKTVQNTDVGAEDDNEDLSEQYKQLAETLRTKKGTLLQLSSLTAFQILNLKLKARKEQHQAFLKTLKKRISGLKELLILHQEETDGSLSQSHFDFADSMISFDKMAGMMPAGTGTRLPESRLKRVQQSLEILEKAQSRYTDKHSVVFVRKELVTEFSLKKTLSAAGLEVTADGPCARAKGYFDREIDDLVHTVAALRIADLEVNQKYEEHLHDPYFESFSRLHLSDDDMRLLPALIVVEEGGTLMHRSEDFLRLITEDIPVKVLAINRLGDLEISDRESTGAIYRQELAALALSHRNAYIFQGGTDTPAMLEKAVSDGLRAPSPVLWNILMASSENDDFDTEILALSTAVESRHFPRLLYDVRAGERFGSHFNISGNTEPENAFPSLTLEINTASGTKQKEFILTPADYFALDPENMSSLEVIPAKYDHDDLMPLPAYLNASQESLIGKIPFIWMLDEKQTLRKVAIPFSWVRRCRERLDFWQFLQELGGVNSVHVQRAIEKAKADWEADKASAIEALKKQFETEAENMRKEEVEKAMERLVNALLDLDNVEAMPSAEPRAQPSGVQDTPPPAEPDHQGTKESAPVEEAGEGTPPPEEDKKEVVEVNSEVWVESFRCTSCNDCIDALPGIFKYNSDKQAFVHNPKGGSYGKIVSIAEKCPARCIHPGLPQNPDESGLDKLIKRAEEFN